MGDNSQPDIIPQDNREKSGSLKTNNLSKTLRVYKREGSSDKPGSSRQAHWGEGAGAVLGLGGNSLQRGSGGVSRVARHSCRAGAAHGAAGGCTAIARR